MLCMLSITPSFSTLIIVLLIYNIDKLHSGVTEYNMDTLSGTGSSDLFHSPSDVSLIIISFYFISFHQIPPQFARYTVPFHTY